MNQILNSSLLQKIIFATSLGFIFFLSVINFKNLEKMTEATKLINETYDISLALENVFVNVKDLETANRNYILTQDDSIKKDNKGENQVKFLPCHSFKSAQNGPKLTGLKQEFRFELRFSRDKFRLILGLRKCKKNNPTSI